MKRDASGEERTQDNGTEQRCEDASTEEKEQHASTEENQPDKHDKTLEKPDEIAESVGEDGDGQGKSASMIREDDVDTRKECDKGDTQEEGVKDGERNLKDSDKGDKSESQGAIVEEGDSDSKNEIPSETEDESKRTGESKSKETTHKEMMAIDKPEPLIHSIAFPCISTGIYGEINLFLFFT